MELLWKLASESGHNNKMQPETFSINLLFFIVIFVAVVAFARTALGEGVRQWQPSKFMEF